jgi:hypothetical protein
VQSVYPAASMRDFLSDAYTYPAHPVLPYASVRGPTVELAFPPPRRGALDQFS